MKLSKFGRSYVPGKALDEDFRPNIIDLKLCTFHGWRALLSWNVNLCVIGHQNAKVDHWNFELWLVQLCT